jgi:hypothetical protein
MKQKIYEICFKQIFDVRSFHQLATLSTTHTKLSSYEILGTRQRPLGQLNKVF